MFGPSAPIMEEGGASRDIKMSDFRYKWYLPKILDTSLLSAAAVIPHKNRKIFEIGIYMYGKPQKFLSDNRGEFAKADFLEMQNS